jgi:hypothetical protein
MKIYFNGDSNVAGSELKNPDEQGFASHLSRMFNASYINDAVGGASNSRILRTTEEYLRNCKKSSKYPDLIVIGWSEFVREDWFIDGNYQSLTNTFKLNFVEEQNPERYNYWIKNQVHSSTYSAQMAKFWNNTIYNFHCELTFLKIPHLFFEAIESFNEVEIRITKDKEITPFNDWATIYHFNWNKNYFHPYNPDYAMINWAENSGYDQITPGKWHYPEPAQIAWAELLYNYINENNLLKNDI